MSWVTDVIPFFRLLPSAPPPIPPLAYRLIIPERLRRWVAQSDGARAFKNEPCQFLSFFPLDKGITHKQAQCVNICCLIGGMQSIICICKQQQQQQQIV